MKTFKKIQHLNRDLLNFIKKILSCSCFVFDANKNGTKILFIIYRECTVTISNGERQKTKISINVNHRTLEDTIIALMVRK